MDNAAVRRQNLRKIIDRRYGGVERKAALALGRAPTALNRYYTKSRARRNIGPNMAREVERLHSLPRGWMDDPDAWLPEDTHESPDRPALRKMELVRLLSGLPDAELWELFERILQRSTDEDRRRLMKRLIDLGI